MGIVLNVSILHIIEHKTPLLQKIFFISQNKLNLCWVLPKAIRSQEYKTVYVSMFVFFFPLQKPFPHPLFFHFHTPTWFIWQVASVWLYFHHFFSCMAAWQKLSLWATYNFSECIVDFIPNSHSYTYPCNAQQKQ